MISFRPPPKLSYYVTKRHSCSPTTIECSFLAVFLLTFHIILWNSWHKISLLLQGSHRVPKLTINLGRPIDGSNGGVTSSSKKHHKKHKHKKKKKRIIDSDEDDNDDVVELSNDSDADYRV